MRIAVLTSTYPHGSQLAAAPFLQPFLDEVRRLGHEPVVFFPRIAASAPESGGEVPVEWTANPRPIVSLSPTRPHDAALILRLLKRWEAAAADAHRDKPFDIVLALWAVPAGLVARRLSRRLGIPYAVWSLGSDINTYGNRFGTRRLVRSVLRHAAAVFANSNVLVDDIEAMSGRHAEFLATSRPIQPPAQLATLPDAVNFVFIGRLEEVKGPDVLLEAVSRLATRAGGWHLTVVGGGSMSQALHERVRGDESLAGRVTLTGHLDGERLLSYLYAADWLVIPSRSESMPVVFAEGLQAGKRFIVADVGDLGYYVDHYELGEVVGHGDAEALASALARAVEAGPGRGQIDPELIELFDINRSAGRFCEVAGETKSPGAASGQSRSAMLRWAKLLWTAIAIAILFFLVRSLAGNWNQLDLSLEDIRWGWLAGSAVMFVAAYAVSSWLWHECLAVFDSSPGYVACFETIVLAQLAKYLPGGIWAVVGQVELSRRAGVRRATALVATGLMSAAVILSGLVFGAIGGAPILALGAGKIAAAAIGVALLAACVHPAVFSRLVALTFGAAGRTAPPVSLTTLDVARVLMVGLIYWPVVGSCFFLMAGAIVNVGYAELLPFAAAYAVSFTIGYVAIFAPGGLGVRETAMVFFLARIVGFAEATLVALAQRVWFTLMELVLAGIWLGARRVMGRTPAPAPDREPPPLPGP